ncbi:MAG TPA: thioredoxin domain-containing protein, partial [Chroococcales cyanobacterium]
LDKSEAMQPSENPDTSASFVTHEQAMKNDKPSVIFFGAKWIDSAYDLNRVLKRGIQKFGDRVNFVRIDCDDPKNADLIDDYGISVVPTIAFLDPANHAVSYELGSLTDETLSFELPKILDVVADAPFAMPEGSRGAVKKPSVVIFGHADSESFKLVQERLKGLLSKLNNRVDFVTVDANDPANAKLFHQYGNNPLPVVLFTNSSHDVISFSTGPASAVDLNKNVQKLLVKKMLPSKKKHAKG